MEGVYGGQLKLLKDEDIGKIHLTSLRVFEEVGIQVNDPADLEIFARHGARVEGNIVKIPEELVKRCLGSAPSEVTLFGREDEHNLTLGGTRVHFGTGGTALYVLDGDQRRKATLDDLRQIARLVEHLNNIHFFLLPTYPNDLEIDVVDINRFFAGLDNTSKHVMGGVYTEEGVDKVIRMAEMIAGGREALKKRPFISMITCVMDPLKLDKHYSTLMKKIARVGIPVVTPAEPMTGATSPVTLAGNLVINNVDTLTGVILTQLVAPSSPVIYGSVATSTDLSDMKYLGGSIEMGLLNAASAQLAQFYSLPFYATAGMSDAKTIDAQSGYESALTSLLCGLAGANFIHDAAGLMEFAKTVSFEKYVVDNEILGMVMRAVKGITVNEQTLAFEEIKRAGPGGNFVSSPHTRRFMRQEHYQPTLSDRRNRGDWEAKGAKETRQRAAERVKEILNLPGKRLDVAIREKVLNEFKEIRR